MLKRNNFFTILILLITLLTGACSSKPRQAAITPSPAAAPTEAVVDGEPVQISLGSPAFSEGESIPLEYTCEGDNLSPELSWSEPPAGTESMLLIVDDPDAPRGTFTHWLLYNIPVARTGLPQGVPGVENVDGIGMQGVNDARGVGYTGPCPPKGAPHHYIFKIYALNTLLSLDPGASRAQLEAAMQGHILAIGQLTGIFER